MSPFKADFSDIDEGGSFPLIPEGWQSFQVTDTVEQVSKKGFPLVQLDAECIGEPSYAGMSIRHWVTVLPKGSKGAGIAKHFLKTIGEPYEGVVEVDPLSWIGKKFRGLVEHQLWDGKKRAKLSQVEPLEGAGKVDEDSVPF